MKNISSAPTIAPPARPAPLSFASSIFENLSTIVCDDELIPHEMRESDRAPKNFTRNEPSSGPKAAPMRNRGA